MSDPYPVPAAPLGAPLYGAGFPVAVRRFFAKYAEFSGRASRSEYWWVQLFLGIVGGALGAVIGVVIAIVSIAAAADLASGYDTGGDYGVIVMNPVIPEPGVGAIVAIAIPSLLYLAVIMATVVPLFAVTVRRLHDADYSGWLALLSFIPYGSIAVLILCAMPTKPEGARFDLVPATPA